MAKFYVESQDSDNRWQLELDVDTATASELLDSAEWLHSDVYLEYVDLGDFTRQGLGYLICGIDDDEIENLMVRVKEWFEEQGIDTEEVILSTTNVSADIDIENDDYGADLFDEIFSGEEY